MVFGWIVAVPCVGFLIYLVLRFLWELIPVGDLSDKAIFISGCDTGFGRALALKCARAGITVFAGCLTEQQRKELESEAKSRYLKTVPLDVTKDESVNNARQYVGNHLKGKKLWAVVNNAGIFSCYGPAEWCTVDEYKLAFEVNTLGVIRCTNAFLDLIKESRGRIITASSVLGRITFPGAAPYCASKYALESYMDGIRLELKPWGVTCSILEPGGCKNTQLLDPLAMEKRVDSVWKKMKPALKEEYGEEYKESYIRCWNEGAKTCINSSVDFVVENYYHAITAKYPRLRYQCGWDSIVLVALTSILPTSLEDVLMNLLRNDRKVVPRCFHKNKAN